MRKIRRVEPILNDYGFCHITRKLLCTEPIKYSSTHKGRSYTISKFSPQPDGKLWVKLSGIKLLVPLGDGYVPDHFVGGDECVSYYDWTQVKSLLQDIEYGNLEPFTFIDHYDPSPN